MRKPSSNKLRSVHASSTTPGALAVERRLPGAFGTGSAVVSTHAENSDVSPPEAVAVAVITRPTGTTVDVVNRVLTDPDPSVVTDVEPTKTSPSPLPLGSQT